MKASKVHIAESGQICNMDILKRKKKKKGPKSPMRKYMDFEDTSLVEEFRDLVNDFPNPQSALEFLESEQGGNHSPQDSDSTINLMQLSNNIVAAMNEWR